MSDRMNRPKKGHRMIGEEEKLEKDIDFHHQGRHHRKGRHGHRHRGHHHGKHGHHCHRGGRHGHHGEHGHHGKHGRRGRHGRHDRHGRHHHHHRHWPPHYCLDQEYGTEFDVIKSEKIVVDQAPIRMVEKRGKPKTYKHGLEQVYSIGQVIKEPTDGKKKFSIALDVTGIPRKDLNVRFADGLAIIEGKSVQDDKFGSVERQFTRKIGLPTGIRQEEVVCKFSSNGIMKIVAKKKKAPIPSESSDSITIIDGE